VLAPLVAVEPSAASKAAIASAFGINPKRQGLDSDACFPSTSGHLLIPLYLDPSLHSIVDGLSSLYPASLPPLEPGLCISDVSPFFEAGPFTPSNPPARLSDALLHCY
jgi:hypothetical protein